MLTGINTFPNINMDDLPSTTMLCHRHHKDYRRLKTRKYHSHQGFEPPELPVQGATSTQFTLFPELPTETRVKIWKALRRPGRVMCLHYAQRASTCPRLTNKPATESHRSISQSREPSSDTLMLSSGSFMVLGNHSVQFVV
jgi:hypothetical protein